MVMMGEVSAGRRVLEGAPLAPGTEATLKNLWQRPSAPRKPLNVEPSPQPETLFMLEILEEFENSTQRGCTGTIRDDHRPRETAIGEQQ